MTIRPFNHSDTDYEACVAINNAIFTNQPASVDAWHSEDDNRDKKFIHQRFIDEQGGHIVGMVIAEEAHWAYAPGKFYVNVMVHPEFQHQGIGSSLYNHAMLAIQDHQPMWFIADTRDDQHNGIQFLESRGFSQSSRHPLSRLDVQAFDPTQFDETLQRITEAGIHIMTGTALLQHDPDYWRKVYELNWVMMQDTTSPQNLTKPDFDEYVQSRTDERRGYSSDLWFIAVESSDPDTIGDYVGLSTLWRSAATPTKLNTGWTGVARTHRRQGLARALKVKAIEYARQAGIVEIETTNEEHNPMFQLNIALGFRDALAWLAFEKRL